MDNVPPEALARLAAMRQSVAEPQADAGGLTWDAGAVLEAVIADLAASSIRTTEKHKRLPDGGQLWELTRCPYSQDHDDSAFLRQYGDGGVHVGCHHARCQGKTIRSVPASFPRTLAVRPTSLQAPANLTAGTTASPIDEAGFAKPVSAAYTDEDLAETSSLFRTPSEIAAATRDRPAFVVDGLLVAGGITALDGKIKQSGKTTFVHEICRSILAGEPFIGRAVQRTNIVYLSEQGDQATRATLARAGLLDVEGMHILSWHLVRSRPFSEVIVIATRFALAHGAGVLIVDTVGQWAGIVGDSENDSGTMLQAAAPLQDAAATHGLGVVVLQHSRKSGGEVGDSARGSSAFGGACDILLHLRRPEGNHKPNIRQLDGVGRFDGIPSGEMLEWTPEQGYRSLGDAAAVAHLQARETILAAITDAAADAVDTTSLVKITGASRKTIQDVVKELEGDGRLLRIGAGKKNDPYRWHAGPAGTDAGLDKHSAAAPSLRAAQRNEPPVTAPREARGHAVRKAPTADPNVPNGEPHGTPPLPPIFVGEGGVAEGRSGPADTMLDRPFPVEWASEHDDVVCQEIV